MEIGRKLYVRDRAAWRKWLVRNHERAREIWLVYYRKDSGKARIPYNDAVEEALCFGWIDSIAKPVDAISWAQRFSQRKKGSKLSPMNRVRVERLVAEGRMTAAGLAALAHAFDARRPARANLPSDIAKALRAQPAAWRNFRRFPETYRRIRVGWIDGARARPAEFRKRLAHFVKMTALNKRFGMVQ